MRVLFAIWVAVTVTVIAIGMSLRDYFAAAALQGLVANGHYQVGMDQPRREVQWSAASYRVAERHARGAEQVTPEEIRQLVREELAAMG